MVWPQPRLMGSRTLSSNPLAQTGQLRYSVHCGAWIGMSGSRHLSHTVVNRTVSSHHFFLKIAINSFRDLRRIDGASTRLEHRLGYCCQYTASGIGHIHTCIHVIRQYQNIYALQGCWKCAFQIKRSFPLEAPWTVQLRVASAPTSTLLTQITVQWKFVLNDFGNIEM